jgi:hypothetical protein
VSEVVQPRSRAPNSASDGVSVFDKSRMAMWFGFREEKNMDGQTWVKIMTMYQNIFVKISILQTNTPICAQKNHYNIAFKEN